ncbi:MAG: hypothetical protein R3C45_01390 [Phycisphaerales bacterium]
MKITYLLAALAPAAWAGPSIAAITLDGTRDAAYGPALAVQTVQTGFGNATNPSGLGGGGELDAAYAVVENGRLYIMLTGNIENNFNKLSLFIDSKPGGENVLSASPQYDYEYLSQNFGGMTFDAGFAADYHLYARWGSLTGSIFTVDIVDRNGGGSATVKGNGGYANVGGGTGVQSGVVNPGDMGLGSTGVGEVRNLTPFLTQPLEFGFNNTNTAGVGGSSGAAANQAAALAVTKGFEFSIALTDIGNPQPGDAIKIHAAYGNGNNNYHSNQILGGLPVGTGNLGGNGAGGSIGDLSGINFNNFAGDQFFTITVTGIDGDLDYDGFVGINDLNIVLSEWNNNGPLNDPRADPSGDGFVGIADLAVILGNWNVGTPPAAISIPEPAMFMCTIALGFGLLKRGNPYRT